MNISYGYYHGYKIKLPFRYVIRLEFLLAFFLNILYSTCVEKGVCFRTALGESLCGSLLCCTFLTDGRKNAVLATAPIYHNILGALNDETSQYFKQYKNNLRWTN